MLREYFSCNERLEIFLTCFCNILCYVGMSTRARRINRAVALYCRAGLTFGAAILRLENEVRRAEFGTDYFSS